MRWTSIALVGVLLITSACAHQGTTREERRACRRARARAAGRGVGIAIGAVVVAAVLVVAAAGGGNVGSLGGGRSRNRRRRRGLEVCRHRSPRPTHAQTMPAPPPPRAPPVHEPPSRDELQAVVEQLQQRLLTCLPDGARPAGDLVLDVEIEGAHGGVASYTMDGPPAGVLQAPCLTDALREVHFPPFDGHVEVRWKIPL